jgi:hypothetical protein
MSKGKGKKISASLTSSIQDLTFFKQDPRDKKHKKHEFKVYKRLGSCYY